MNNNSGYTTSKKLKAVTFSVISNSVLVVFKLIVGIAIGSVSVMSEAIHSAIDLVAAAIAFFAVRSSSRPADKEHQYGHGKFENISGFVEALLIFIAAIWIIFEAVKKLINPTAMEMAGWGVLVMAISSVVNFFVSSVLFKVGKETDSIAITADAWHLRTDVYTSLGVMFGLALIWIIENLFLNVHVHWIDPLIAIVVAFLIIKAAYDLTKQSLGGLADESLPAEENKKIADIISSVDNVISYKHFHTRKAGDTRFVEIDILVDANMSVQAAHDLTETIMGNIDKCYNNTQVLIHVEPCNNACEKAECADNCKTLQSPK